MTDPAVPPFVLVTGPEGVLVERAVAAVLEPGKRADVEVIRIDPATYESGALQMHASPSLFGGAKTIVVRDLHESPDELQLDLLSLLAVPDPDLGLVVAHGGGMKGKKVVDTMKKAGARVIE